MNLLTVDNIKKSYTERMLFDGVAFGIEEQDKIGIIGVNGTGKSTLLKMISGLEETDEGTITKGSHVMIRFLPQNPVFEEGDTVLEAVLRDNRKKENQWTIESEAKSILNKLGISDFNQKTGELSGGQKKRVALAAVLITKAEILVLDEPTNHLDNEMSQWLEDYLNQLNAAVVMVTHDRYFLDRVSNKILEIDKGAVYIYPGNYSEFVRLKSERQNMELASERKRQSILRVELEWLARGARARSTKQKAHIQRIENMQAQKGPEDQKDVEMSSVSSRLGRKTVEVNHISKAYGDKQLIKDFSYIFLRQDRIGIIGNNGCGKSTLLKIITGLLSPDEGQIDIGQTVKIGYFAQENDVMEDSVKVIDSIREIAEYVQTTEGSISASQMLERFLFDGTMQWSPIGKLSGGERRRLSLLKVLMGAPNVLILDEPTNDLDIQTLTILEDYLDSFDGIVVTVSHDRYFLDRVVRRIFAFEGNGSILQYEGGYSDYLFKCQLKQDEEKQRTREKEKKNGEKSRVREKKLKFTYQEQKDYETIDEDIAKLEESILEFEQQIEAASTSYGKLNELMEAKALVEKELEEKMERWMYLNDLADQIEAERSKNE